MHRRNHDHRHVRVFGAQLGKQAYPVHFGHYDVAQHQVERIVPESLESDHSVRAHGTLVPLCVEQGRNDLSNRLFVVYYQDFLSLHRRLRTISIVSISWATISGRRLVSFAC